MAKQTPKVSELVEVLIQQMTHFESILSERNDILTKSISKLNGIQVEIKNEDFLELEHINESYQKVLKDDFSKFHKQTININTELLKMHKNVSSKRLLYLIVLNVFLILSTGISMYIAVKNHVNDTEHQSLIKEKNELKKMVNITNEFFSQHPKTESYFKDWLKK